ncbi:MAG: acetylxylan esterase [Planctomycetes bacterium]|nr:acetylxylan esterase [Planctomycetota bacterium]
MFSLSTADSAEPNYDESRVPAYTLPDLLVTQDARPVKSATMWRATRRPELLDLFATQVYGRRMTKPAAARYEVTETSALEGTARRKQVNVDFVAGDKTIPGLTITMYVPAGRRAVPAFVGLHLFDTSAKEPKPAMPIEAILQRGYAIATLNASDFCPDDKDRFREGVLAHDYPGRNGPPGPEEPGAIATWAWGLSRAMDYFETDADIDANRVAVIGHSRMGKTALWAGAEDERFAIVISNESGCGGAALSRRQFGETVRAINDRFPHWFCGNFRQYNDKEDTLPVDQHMLIALIAPRPVYVASAEEDRWADPRGEFLAAFHASPVYHLLGTDGLPADEMPPIDNPVHGTIAYHIRAGEHDLARYDWEQYLHFADRQWKQEK